MNTKHNLNWLFKCINKGIDEKKKSFNPLNAPQHLSVSLELCLILRKEGHLFFHEIAISE